MWVEKEYYIWNVLILKCVQLPLAPRKYIQTEMCAVDAIKKQKRTLDYGTPPKHMFVVYVISPLFTGAAVLIKEVGVNTVLLNVNKKLEDVGRTLEMRNVG